jgi:hypothetical protein
MGCIHSQEEQVMLRKNAPLVHKNTYRSHLHDTKVDTYVFQQQTDRGYSMPEITVTQSFDHHHHQSPRVYQQAADLSTPTRSAASAYGTHVPVF